MFYIYIFQGKHPGKVVVYVYKQAWSILTGIYIYSTIELLIKILLTSLDVSVSYVKGFLGPNEFQRWLVTCGAATALQCFYCLFIVESKKCSISIHVWKLLHIQVFKNDTLLRCSVIIANFCHSQYSVWQVKSKIT